MLQKKEFAMKHTLSLFTILLVFIGINTTAQETDWEKEELKGKVKTMKEYRYFILDSIRFDSIFYSDSFSGALIMNVISDTSFAILIDTLEPPVIKTYSEEGHLLTKEDVGWSTTKYKYDKNGNLTAATVYDNEKDVYSKNKYKYSKTGDLIKEKHYRKQKPAFERINYQYDRYNNIVSIKSFVLNTNSYGKKIRCRKATESYRYEYDSCGRMLKSYHTGGVLTPPSCDEDYPYETIYIYDDKGNLEKTYHYEYNSFCDGIPITKYSTTKLYDGKGNVIEEKGIYYYLTKNTAVHDPVIRYEYDSEGRCTSQLRYGENCISHWITNYDEHGNISQRLSGCGDERKVEDEYKYLYDDNNWIIKLSVLKGRNYDFRILEYREIEYF